MEIIAVVPIVVNVGAAVLPTLMAAVTSIAILILRPRELLDLCRRRPKAVCVWVAVVALGVLVTIGLLAHGRSSRAAARSARAGRPDWAKVAEGLIAQQKIHEASSTASVVPVSVAAGESALAAAPDQPTDPTRASRAMQDSSRTLYRGGPLPSGLKCLWSFCPEDTLFLGTPVVAGDHVFVAGCQSDLGGYTGLLACLDRKTGRPLWQVTEDKGEPLRPFFSSPALTEDGKSIVIGQGLHEDRDCSLLCFEAATGQLRWQVKTPLHIESSPVIHGDLAVVGAGAIEGRDGRAVGDPGFCLAVRISDGQQIWREPVNDPESSPAVDANGIVYIGSGLNGCAVLALRIDSAEGLAAKGLGRVVWRTPVAHPITGPISLFGDKVIAGGGNGDMVHSNRDPQGVVVALDRRTGAILWQTRLDDAVLGGVACRDGVLICPVRTGEVAALAQEDGRLLWRTKISGSSPVLGGCAFAGQRVYAVSNDGFLAVLDSRDGKVLERIYLNDQAKPGTGLTLASPQVVAGGVIVGSETGGLRCMLGSGGAD